MRILIECKNKLVKNPVPAVLCIFVWGLSAAAVFRNSDIKTSEPVILMLLTIQLISSVIDICTKTIPFKLTAFSVFAGCLLHIIFEQKYMIFTYLLSGAASFALMKLIVLISKNQVGGGDLALMTVTGLFVGFAYFLSILFTSVVLAGLYSFVMMLFKRAAGNTEIPFAPFVLCGTAITILINY